MAIEPVIFRVQDDWRVKPLLVLAIVQVDDRQVTKLQRSIHMQSLILVIVVRVCEADSLLTSVELLLEMFIVSCGPKGRKISTVIDWGILQGDEIVLLSATSTTEPRSILCRSVKDFINC